MQQGVHTDMCLRFRFFLLLIDMNTWQWDTSMCFESLRWGQCSRFDSRLLDRTQDVTSNNAGSCRPTMLPPSYGAKNLLTRKQFVKFSDYHEKCRLGYQPLIGKWAHALPALLLRSLLEMDTRERRKSSIPQASPLGKIFLVKKSSFDTAEKSNFMPLNLPRKVSKSGHVSVVALRNFGRFLRLITKTKIFWFCLVIINKQKLTTLSKTKSKIALTPANY